MSIEWIRSFYHLPEKRMLNNPDNSNFSKRNLGIILVALSFMFYGMILLVPFAPLSSSYRIILSMSLIILGEISFWMATIILGKKLLSRFNIIKNFRNLFGNFWRSESGQSFCMKENCPKERDDSDEIRA